MKDTEKVLIAFLSGAIVGAAAGMLLAPDSGKNTRKKVVETASDFKHGIGDTIEAGSKKMKELADTAITEVNKYGKKIKGSISKKSS